MSEDELIGFLEKLYGRAAEALMDSNEQPTDPFRAGRLMGYYDVLAILEEGWQDSEVYGLDAGMRQRLLDNRDKTVDLSGFKQCYAEVEELNGEKYECYVNFFISAEDNKRYDDSIMIHVPDENGEVEWLYRHEIKSIRRIEKEA